MIKPAKMRPITMASTSAGDGFLYDVGLVVKDAKLDAPGGRVGRRRLDCVVDLVGHLHGIAVGLAIDTQQHGLLAVGERWW